MDKPKDWFDALLAKEKEALYRAELENYSEKMVLNIDGQIIFINEKYAAEFGKRPEELEGLHFEELVSQEKIPVLLDMNDFATPYIPHSDKVGFEQTYVPIFIRAAIYDETGQRLGDMLYDGRDWLQRYRMLNDRINRLMDEYEYLHPKKGPTKADVFVGESPPVLKLKKEIMQVSKSNATLLIEGETGTGREVVANEVFRAGGLENRKFIKLNCAALPQELFESELFGYEEGAFTGARRGGKRGLFEAADGGVILLDEINSLSLSAQAKLLRVLQERNICRIGGEKPIPINVRVIATSNKPLEQMVKENSFRADLYYRLNVMHICIPPLRERIEDIPQLVRFFVERCNRDMGKHVDRIDPKVYSYLKLCKWPGNVRQLQNWVERAMASVWKNVLMLTNFYWISSSTDDTDNKITLMAQAGKTLPQMMDELEKEIIQNTLKLNGGNKQKTAKKLGISRQMLHRKIKQFHIE